MSKGRPVPTARACTNIAAQWKLRRWPYLPNGRPDAISASIYLSIWTPCLCASFALSWIVFGSCTLQFDGDAHSLSHVQQWKTRTQGRVRRVFHQNNPVIQVRLTCSKFRILNVVIAYHMTYDLLLMKVRIIYLSIYLSIYPIILEFSVTMLSRCFTTLDTDLMKPSQLHLLSTPWCLSAISVPLCKGNLHLGTWLCTGNGYTGK